MRTTAAQGLGFAGLMLSGAIFGFFYAWVCSTMWGLDAADPRVAIAAMQAMNASVRNAVFAPAFFGTPFVLLAAGAAAWLASKPGAALAFGLGGLAYLAGGLFLTMAVNVPMNEALAQLAIPANVDEASAIWQGYSPRWQLFNTLRTVVSAGALAAAGLDLFLLGRPARR